jgi:hypothetical protein
MIAIAFARAPNLPISLRALQLGTLHLNDADPDASARRYHVREWRPSDGGFAGWKFHSGDWSWCYYAPRRPGEYFTIIRLADNAISVAPRRWWRCDPRGMPRDDDDWAEAAWNVIRLHYVTQRRWFQ